MRKAIPLLAALVLVGCSDVLGPSPEHAWTVSEGTDQISGLPHVTLRNRSASRVDLLVRCRERRIDVYVTTDFVMESNRVRYNIDGDARTESWRDATDFRGAFYPGNARAFADRLAGSKEMVVGVREYGASREHVGTFRVSGLGRHLPKVYAACAQ
jgi:hypothetical protein